MVPPSLLSDIQDIKAMVRAVAAGVSGAQASGPQTGPEQMAAGPTSSTPEARARINQPTPTPFHHQPKPPDVDRNQRPEASSPHASSPSRRRISLPAEPQTTPPVTTPSTADTPSHCDGASSSDRPGAASEHVDRERHHQPQAVEQEAEVQESSTRGIRRGSASADGCNNTLPVSPEEGKDGGETGRRTPSTCVISHDGGGKGGPTLDGEGRDGHEPPLLDETAAGENEDSNIESTEFDPPVTKDDSSVSVVAEASRFPSLKDNVVGVDGEGDGGTVGLLDEAPEEKCYVR